MSDGGQTESTPVSHTPRKRDLLDWVDSGSKLIIAIVGVAISWLGYSYQRSFTTSELLGQQQKADTDIRAQMFSKITDRLMKPPETGKASPVQDALLVQVLALNFHEIMDLKPLMINLDDQLSQQIMEKEKTGTSNDESEVMQRARENLRWVARRVRDREVSALIKNPRPSGDAAGKLENGGGGLYYASVLRKGPKSHNRCSIEERDGKKRDGRNGCLGEVMEFAGPGKERAMFLSVDKADWNKERFIVSLNTGKPDPTIELPTGAARKAQLRTAEECIDRLNQDQGLKKQTVMEAGHKKFKVTWFDFPFSDNTLEADGNRYAVFIDEVCKDADAKPEDEPNAVRLGLLYFPKDYYPSERPVTYKQLSSNL
jgi:hypothetical protein